MRPRPAPPRQTLAKNTEDEEQKVDVLSGHDAAQRVLRKANETLNRRQLDKALASLVTRVDDWKNHTVEQFGKLLMHGIYGVVTGKSDTEKVVSVSYVPFSSLLSQRRCRPSWYADTNRTSTTSTSSSLSSSAAKKSSSTGARTRRKRQSLPGLGCQTRTRSSSSRGGSS